MEEYRHFTLIVVGDNPQELIEKYDSNLKVDKYCVYKFADAEKLYHSQLKVLKGLYLYPSDNESFKDMVGMEISELESISPIEYYAKITDGLDIDEDTGDAYSTRNLNGKYDGVQEGGVFALPLIDKDGNETYHCVKSEVDWERVHLTDTEPYEVAWDCVMEGKAPKNDFERSIYENMKNRTYYFEQFGDRDNYIRSNTSFWGYAFLSEETGWVELEYSDSQFKWVCEFFDRFIKPLDDNTMISVYECTRTEECEYKKWAEQ